VDKAYPDMTRKSISVSLGMTMIAVGLWGCGGGGGGGAGYRDLKLAPISGVVKIKGQPVEKPVVTFYPDTGPTGIGVGNEQGEFSVKTNGQNGAPVGKCKVTVTAGSAQNEFPPSDGKEMQLLKKARLNAKYASPDTTDLFVDVTADGNADLQLDLDD